MYPIQEHESPSMDFQPKVKSDVEKISKVEEETHRGYKKIFFMSNQYIPDKQRAEKEDKLRKEYNIDVTYYINSSDRGGAAAIQAQAETAVEEYELWQASKIGRDINPDELIARMNDAGVKRAVIREPAFRIIGDTAKAQCTGASIIYGGLEND